MYPSLTGTRHGIGFVYLVDVVLPALGVQRRVRIRFAGSSREPSVVVDGPTTSPHRYDDTIVAHLLREEWWRRTGRWAGLEAPHATGRTT